MRILKLLILDSYLQTFEWVDGGPSPKSARHGLGHTKQNNGPTAQIVHSKLTTYDLCKSLDLSKLEDSITLQ